MPRIVSAFKTILPAVLVVGGIASAHAGQINLVQNGGFETTSMTSYCPTGQTSNCADQMTTSNVSNWSTGGYNFIYTPTSLRTSGSQAGDPLAYQTGGGLVGLYNATAPSTYTGQYATIFSSPAGGNIVGADGAFQVGAITQTVNGMEIGGDYAVTFWYGGAQQDTYSGTTTEAWKVSLGGQSFETPVLTNASHGFTGWYSQTFIFEATSTSEVLSFLAIGTPSGEPPFSLLDGVTDFEVPEPGTVAMMCAGVAGLILVARKRRLAA
jgi:hypothetical protein